MIGKKTVESKFWDWFADHQDLYFSFENNQEKLFDQLKKQLNKIDKNLTFEFSPVFENDKREFVISADGIKESFPVVKNLIESAPSLSNWIFVAFRQPRNDFNQIQLNNITLDMNDVFFRFAKDKGKIGIELNIRGYEDTPDWTAASFIMLDSLLGEYDTEMSLGWIDKKALDENDVEQLFPLKDLPAIVHQYKLELNN